MKSLAGFALALSLAGYFFSRFGLVLGSRRQRRLLPPPATDGCGREGGLREGACGLMENEENSQGFICGTTTDLVSPTSTSSGDAEGYLLPEFNELVLGEFQVFTKETCTPIKHGSDPRKMERKDLLAMDEVIAEMKDLVQSLKTREKKLELQLQEYYGLQEQKSTVIELENRLKINKVEAKALIMKIESLQADNRRLEAQLSEYSAVEAELDDARETIKNLEWKMRCDSEQARDMLDALHERLTTLQASEGERKEYGDELRKSFQRLRALEDEAADLRNENSKLVQENLVIMEKLESGTVSASPRLTSEDSEVLEEANYLKQANDELSKEIAQLQMDVSADVEELVYLKWLNACLRYELKDYQHLEDKSVARELGKTSSPGSGDKAKQLLVDYANSGTNAHLMMDFNSECSSSPSSSSVAESGDFDDSSVSTKNSSSSGTKKFFGKLKKLVLGKDGHRKLTRGVLGSSGRRASLSNYSFDDMFSRRSFDGATSCIVMGHDPIYPSGRLDFKDEKHCLEEARIMKNERCRSDLGSLPGHRQFMHGGRSGSHHTAHAEGESVDFPEKEELKKFASALMSTARSPQFRRRSDSLV